MDNLLPAKLNKSGREGEESGFLGLFGRLQLLGDLGLRDFREVRGEPRLMLSKGQ